jgi:hypothetical protein
MCLSCLPVGLNNNAYQISRALYHNGRTGRNLDQVSRFVKADFMKQPFEDNTFDAVYQIDATCHAPDQVGCYKVSNEGDASRACLSGYYSSPKAMLEHTYVAACEQPQQSAKQVLLSSAGLCFKVELLDSQAIPQAMPCSGVAYTLSWVVALVNAVLT